MMTDTQSVNHVIRNDFIQARIQEIRDGVVVNDSTVNRNKENIVEPLPSNEEIAEHSEEENMVEEENTNMTEENVNEQEAQPEVIEPEIVDDDMNYPMIPVRFQSFREKLANLERNCYGWQQQIIEKMSDREKMLQKAHQKLEEENKELDTLNNQYVYK